MEKKEIELDDDDRDVIARAARASGRHWKEILKESLSIVATKATPWPRFFEELNRMPSEGKSDGVCASEQHDEILYGGE